MSVLERDLVTVTGPDTFSFLQSLLSQDVEGLDDGAVVASLLLTPKGKVQFSFRVIRVGDDAWLDVDAGFGEALRTALERFKLRVKVEIASPAEAWGMVAMRGDAFVAVDDVPATGRMLPVGWSTTIGVDVIAPAADLVELGRAASMPVSTSRPGSKQESRVSAPISTRARFRRRPGSTATRSRSPRVATWARSSSPASIPAAT